MLTYENALKILSRYGKKSEWIRHCLAVANVATVISLALEDKNGTTD